MRAIGDMRAENFQDAKLVYVTVNTWQEDKSAEATFK